jgi:hypothetical protein
MVLALNCNRDCLYVTAMNVIGIIENPLLSKKAKILNFITDWRVFVPGLFFAGYIVGILAASHIRNPDSVAYVHQGPYAFVGIYKKELYELIPMEESVRLHQLQRTKAKPEVQEADNLEPFSGLEPEIY